MQAPAVARIAPAARPAAGGLGKGEDAYRTYRIGQVFAAKAGQRGGPR